MEIIFDSDLLEHVLINLVNISAHALRETENGKIQLTAEINKRGRAVLKVIDNCCGITEDVLDKVFVPFFTTKQEGRYRAKYFTKYHPRSWGKYLGSIPTKYRNCFYVTFVIRNR